MKKIIFTLFIIANISIAQENFSLLWTGTHSGYVNAIKTSPDGSKVYSGSDDKTVKAWNATNGNLLWTGNHTDKVNFVDVSPDGSKIVSSGNDKTIKMWRAADGALLWTGTDVDIVTSAQFSSSGTKIISVCQDNLIKCWDAGSGALLWTGIHDTPFNTGINFLSISRDGNYAATCSDRFIKVWNIHTETLLMITLSSSNISSVFFNNDGSKLVSSEWSGNVKIWNISNGTLLHNLVHGGIVNSAKYSPDGRTIVSTGNNKSVKLWNGENGELIWTGNHNDEVTSVCFSPDGSRIASGSGAAESLIKIWNASNGFLLWISTIGQAGQTVSRIIYSPDGNKLINANYQDNSIKYWTKTPTAIGNELIPPEYCLNQNYPNPFNPTTVISYQLSANGWVTLKVYDLLGKEIATLVNEYKQAGVYVETFHGTSLPSGISVKGRYPSGVYFYRLTAGSFSETKKMILLR